MPGLQAAGTPPGHVAREESTLPEGFALPANFPPCIDVRGSKNSGASRIVRLFRLHRSWERGRRIRPAAGRHGAALAARLEDHAAGAAEELRPDLVRVTATDWTGARGHARSVPATTAAPPVAAVRSSDEHDHEPVRTVDAEHETIPPPARPWAGEGRPPMAGWGETRWKSRLRQGKNGWMGAGVVPARGDGDVLDAGEHR